MNSQIKLPIKLSQGIVISPRMYELKLINDIDMTLQHQIQIWSSIIIYAMYICYILWLRQIHRRIQTQTYIQGA